MNTEPDNSERSAFSKHLRARMISGILVLIPLAITIFLFNIILKSLTAFVSPWISLLLTKLPASYGLKNPDYAVTLLALCVTLLIIYFTGLLTNHIIGRRMISLGERVLMKMPIIKSIYSASKQVVDTFSSSTKAAFKAVAVVEFPRKGSLAIGFVTGSMTDPDGHLLYRVFIATTPNPTTGFLLILPADEVQFTDISVEDGVKMIVSGGVLSPESYQRRPPPSQSTPVIG
ncbi:MAG: DUF502 domain-containing protein [bacterium]